MIHVTVLCPVLGRPDRAAPLVESLHASVSGPVANAEVMFVASRLDVEQRDACRATEALTVVADWEAGSGDYARKINLGVAMLMRHDPAYAPVPDFVLLGADDLVFHPGWLEAALIAQLETGACVIATNDLGNPAVIDGRHATHPLVHRAYVECGTVDEPGKLLHEGYDHCFVDNEFTGTAKARGTFTAASRSRVEHMHPIWRKGAPDETYRKGQRAFDADRRLHEQRRRLWEAP